MFSTLTKSQAELRADTPGYFVFSEIPHDNFNFYAKGSPYSYKQNKNTLSFNREI
ncbi:hypothetical protein SAMN05421821_102521 [Mucilaginibacter lappiensis]|uniref:Uncharacterized protein n=1 Tax=Mucilaginibacter lappiensis TaxID=354630 RepID=A0A1N6SXZ6_9SPHI|nr:hypothetical protein [Mucilaginibacter lappiensis]MBB6130384.1 hypothetical protein [Mucilaginibacter lappiensis]SIQ45932.1 hypothetical protein SAMN05421821_102521 [Mucilaginibacter lappiensis]